MTQQTSSPSNLFSTLLDKLGLAAGLVAAFILVMPAYEMSRPYVKSLVLNEIPYGIEQFAIPLWWILLFFLITCAVRFAVMAVVGVITSLLSVIAVKFTLWRTGSKPR